MVMRDLARTKLAESKRFAAVLFVVASAGCAPAGPTRSAAYEEGYRYGCYNGYDAAGYNWYWGLAHNKPTYSDSPEWQAAWDKGYRDCFNRGLLGDTPADWLEWRQGIHRRLP
jgi:hypothetical protein